MSSFHRFFAILLGSALLLAASPAASRDRGRPDRSCAIRRAEATICPSFRVYGEGEIVNGLSGDGSTVVGLLQSDGESRPVRWVNGGRRELPGLPPNLLFGSANAASLDGSVIAGIATVGPPSFISQTFRWQRGAYEAIGEDAGFDWFPSALSGDGRVVVGGNDGFGGRWREEIGSFEEWEGSMGFPVAPTGISDAGEMIVGTRFVPFQFGAFQWIGDATTELVVPDGREALAVDVSPDGSVVVGSIAECFDSGCGVIWRDGVFEPREFFVEAASWNGVFLAGHSLLGPAYYWDATGTVRALSDLLAELGIDVSASLRRTIDMSYDGHVVIGFLDGGGFFRAVVAPKLGIDIQPSRRSNRIDLARRRPVRVRVYGSEQADASHMDPEDLRFGPDRAPPSGARPPFDYNRDGHLDRDFWFDPAEAGLALGDREACLAGVAADLPFRLCSRVRTTWGRFPWRWFSAWRRE